MAAITFDTHKLIRKLENAGFNAKQAEVATKTDLRELEYRLVIKLGGMMMACVAVVATLVKLL